MAEKVSSRGLLSWSWRYRPGRQRTTFPAVADADKGVGPELSQMAGMHPVEFFGESVMNPDAVVGPDAKQKDYLGEDGKSKMPNYNDILTVKRVSDLAVYLASLKGASPKTH